MNETQTLECLDCIEDGHMTAIMHYIGTDRDGKRWYMCGCCHADTFIMSDVSAMV